jgi:hypothetical protein
VTLVQNVSHAPVDDTDGTPIGVGDQVDVDTSNPYYAELLSEGVLRIVGAVTPGLPVSLPGRPLHVIASQAQPSASAGPVLWVHIDDQNTFLALKVVVD